MHACMHSVFIEGPLVKINKTYVKNIYVLSNWHKLLWLISAPRAPQWAIKLKHKCIFMPISAALENLCLLASFH